MPFSERLLLPLLDAAQAQKHVTHNEAVVALDALVQLSVSTRNVTTPAPAPDVGMRVLVGTGATGVFAGHDGCIAAFGEGGWSFFTPRAGWQLHVADENALLLFDGTAWNDIGLAIRTLQNLSGLGIGTTSDPTNALAAKLNAGLFTARGLGEGGTGDLRLTLNKSATANTASTIYQTSYSARAEAGLAGSDDFAIKVSADGATWHTGLTIDGASGLAKFPSGISTRSFCDVALDGGTATFGATFSRIPLNVVNADPGGNWDAANHWYVCPRAGVYSIGASLRVGPGGDASTERGYQYGLGVYTSEADGPWLFWHEVGPAPALRSTGSYARLSRQNAGDRLRMVTFSDQGVVVYRAGLQIAYVGND